MELMTVFYSKRNGELKAVCLWETTFQEYLPTSWKDYALIWNVVKLPKDEYVAHHVELFMYDKELGKIFYKVDANPQKYSRN
ncbi:hypothetical protein V7166_21730 [Bacillus thuringiensis]